MTIRALRIAGALCLIGGITALTLSVRGLNQTTITLMYLMGVLAIAAKLGLVEAVIASIACIACKAYFFLPPILDFAIEDPQNWVAVGAFFVISVVASQLSTSALRRAQEAQQRQRELEQLYEWSQRMMSAEMGGENAGLLLEHMTAVFGLSAAAFHDSTANATFRKGQQAMLISEDALRLAAVDDAAMQVQAGNVVLLPVTAGGRTYGSLGLVGGTLSQTALQSVAHLAAVALERADHQEAATRAEVVRQGQELKSLLLNSVAHEFKTPLTSIKFGATVLQSDSGLKPSQRELVTVIEEESDRMNGMITEAIQVSRLEAGNMQMDLAPQDVRKLIVRGIERRDRLLAEREMTVEVASDLPPVTADAGLVSIAVAHLLDNAVKYSPEGSPVLVSARQEVDSVVVSVVDRGPGLTPEERKRVFQRFYRGASGKRTPGSGMGLFIVQEIIKVHDGAVWVENVPEGGACFSFRLPAAGSMNHE